ncbi:2OG-Fe(II) oxygenase [Pigmentibacter sp. JX0631]|uniref:2OG-Fe(II) oxygenase n=1 Tax=Pigmentibacter sp. JX0631 TaxID=2976982 RepID=UPI00246857C0|nr:2OG-Fe(II) oxygenase [Pigmentibacter sp. JX0631]WGL61224.1 2OG-Fe(II) oxygenase [Pigmentibacter sp. JX0631]
MNLSGSELEGRFKEVAKSIYIGELISESFCNDLLLEIRDFQDWKQAKIAISRKNNEGISEILEVIDTNHRSANSIRLSDLNSNEIPIIVQSLKKIQTLVGEFATKEFGLTFNEFGDAELIRYNVGGLFKPHTDAHNENSHRALTVITYLNDNYTGGETYFPDQNYKCIPKTGRVLFFLSSELHASLPIIEGNKNIIVFWAFYPGSIGRKNIKSFP